MPNFIAADSYGQWTGFAQQADQQAAANYWRQLEAQRQAQQFAAQVAIQRDMAMREQAARKAEADRAFNFQREQAANEMALKNKELELRNRQLEIQANPYKYNWEAFKYADQLARSGEATPEQLATSFQLSRPQYTALKASADQAAKEAEDKYAAEKSIVNQLNERNDLVRQQNAIKEYVKQPTSHWYNPASWWNPGRLPAEQIATAESDLAARVTAINDRLGSLPKGYVAELPVNESGDYLPPRDRRIPASTSAYNPTESQSSPVTELKARRVKRFLELKGQGMSDINAKTQVMREIPL